MQIPGLRAASRLLLILALVAGLAPATVSNIVRDLQAAELVETTVGAGRRGTTVRIAIPNAADLANGIEAAVA